MDEGARLDLQQRNWVEVLPLLSKGEWDGAISYLTTRHLDAEQMGDLEALFAADFVLALCYQKLGWLEEAYNYYTCAISQLGHMQMPELKVECGLLLSKLHFQQQDYKRAEAALRSTDEYLKQAVGWSPDDRLAHKRTVLWRMSAASELSGDRDDAQQYLAQHRGITPEKHHQFANNLLFSSLYSLIDNKLTTDLEDAVSIADESYVASGLEVAGRYMNVDKARIQSLVVGASVDLKANHPTRGYLKLWQARYLFRKFKLRPEAEGLAETIALVSRFNPFVARFITQFALEDRPLLEFCRRHPDYPFISEAYFQAIDSLFRAGLGDKSVDRGRATLLEELDKSFSEGELRTLAFDLRVDFENLPGHGKKDKARELILYLERRSRIPDLVSELCKLRPGVAWGECARNA